MSPYEWQVHLLVISSFNNILFFYFCLFLFLSQSIISILFVKIKRFSNTHLELFENRHY
jgi:hypothetical protein